MRDMATIEERTTRLEADVENEQEWRRAFDKKLDRIEAKIDTNQRWLIGIVLTSVSIAVAVIKFL